ncbi:hypothetical protein GCM10012319_73940 [Comamonas sp. KCTC 72670]|nr:hypothetical protein GCM10012319_73940 [Comamonas sp. KCTC 72670]
MDRVPRGAAWLREEPGKGLHGYRPRVTAKACIRGRLDAGGTGVLRYWGKGAGRRRSPGGQGSSRASSHASIIPSSSNFPTT